MLKVLFSISVWITGMLTGMDSFGQQTPLWTADVDYNVNWMKVTPFGQVLASTPKGLYCVDPETGKILWNIEDLKGCLEQNYNLIEGSRFFTISPGNSNDVVEVVDMFDGKVLFNSYEAGIKEITDQFYLRNQDKLLLFGKLREGKKSSLLEVMVDLSTGKTLWSKENTYRFVGNIEAVGTDEVLVVSPAFVTKINATTGAEIWKTPVDPLYANSSSMLKKLEKFVPKPSTDEKQVKLIFSPYRPEICIVAIPNTDVGGSSMASSIFEKMKSGKDEDIVTSNFSAFNINTGEYIWKDKVTIDHEMGVCFPTENGLLVGSGNDGHFNMITYDEGAILFKTKFKLSFKKSNQPDKNNSPNFRGVLTNISLLKGNQVLLQGVKDRSHLFYASDNPKKISILNITDIQNGSLSFDNSAEIRGTINYIMEIDKGVLVGTERSLALLDPASGNWIFENDIKCDPSLVCADDNNIYFFNTNDNRLYNIAFNASALTAITDPVNFEGKEKVKRIELIKEGIFLGSDQNMALVDFDGKIKYQKYFSAPANSTLVKALLSAGMLAGAFATTAIQGWVATKEINRSLHSDFKYNLKESMGTDAFIGQSIQNFNNAGGMGKMVSIWNKRYKATRQEKDYQVLITQEVKNSTPVLLKKVNKSTGETDAEVELGKDREPLYDLDLIEGRLYYINFKKGNLMECYKF